MKTFLMTIALLATGPALAQSTPTLVQQLSSYLAYEQAEALEYGPPPTCGSNCYHYYRAARLTKQLATAVAACNAGSCLPPLIDESGNVQQPFGTSAVSRGTK
jgi:hypothetical protein